MMLLRNGLLCALYCVLAACGGGGGDGSAPTSPVNPSPPSPPPVIGVAADYWVSDPAGLWLFNGRDNTTVAFGSPLYRDQVTVGAPLTLGGQTLTRFNYARLFNDGSGVAPQYRSLGAEGIRAYIEEMPTSLTLAYVELPSQIRAETFRAYELTEAVPGGTHTLRIDITVVGFENLSVPAGKFADALKVTQRFTASATINGQTGTAVANINLWYAKGIGIIKQVFDNPNANPSVGTNVEELAGVLVPGLRAGVIGEFTLLGDLTAPDSSLDTGRPGIASDGSGFLTAARRFDSVTNMNQIVATYLSASGGIVWTKTVLEARIADDEPVPVTFDGANFWIVARAGSGSAFVGQRVSPAGQLLDPIAGSATVGDGLWPRLASDGSSVLMIYSRSNGTATFELFSTLFNRDGSVRRAEQKLATIVPRNSTSESSGRPAVTSNGDQYLVVFEDGNPRDVKSIRVSASGDILDPIAIETTSATGEQRKAAVVPWGAMDFIALWADKRNSVSGLDEDDDIYGARISATGTLLDAPAHIGGVLLDRCLTPRSGPAGATGAMGTLLVWPRGPCSSTSSISQDPSGIFGRRILPAAPFAVSDPGSEGLLIGLRPSSASAVSLSAPSSAASAEGFCVVWVEHTFNVNRKSVRGALVYPPVGGP